MKSPHDTAVGRKAWIVTTIFDRDASLETYLGCLDRQRFKNFSLVLVDHGVIPAFEQVALRDYIIVLRESPNKWWTAAVNAGIRYVMAREDLKDHDLIVLQNDDSVFSEGFLDALVRASSQKNAVVGSVAVIRNTTKILHANLKFSWVRAKYNYLNYGADISELKEELYESDVLKGRGVVYPVSLVRQIGLLDERLPQYKSDHEWAHRAKQLGFPVFVTPSAITETVLDTQERVIAEAPFRSLWRVLFSRRSPMNIPDTIKYFYICFNPVSATYYCFVDVSRTILFSTAKALLLTISGRNTIRSRGTPRRSE